MNKKLIALALAALPAAAMADVTMYGIMKIGVENTSLDRGNDANGHSLDRSQNRIDDYGSRIGFKGTEDLGDGLKAIWQIEQALRLDGVSHDGKDAATFRSRDTFVGLDFGEFGKVRLGRLSTQLNDPLSIVDFWEYDAGANGLGVFTRTGTRLNNAIRYDSADWYGFNFNLIYGTYEQKGTEDATSYVNAQRAAYNLDNPNDQVPLVPSLNQYRNSNVFGLGLNYQNSGFFASYGFEYRPDDYVNGESASWENGYIHRLEVGYNANNLFVGLGYQYTKGAHGWGTLADSSGQALADFNDNLVGTKTSELALSVGYTIGAFTPKFTYAHGWDMKYVGNADVFRDLSTGYNQYVLGVDYALSKRTTAGFSWGLIQFDKDLNLNTDRDDKVKYSTIALDLIHRF